jgi:hypothetical protein
MSMTPTLFLAGVILPAKIFFIQHVHTVLIAIRSKNSNGFGNNCINQVFFYYFEKNCPWCKTYVQQGRHGQFLTNKASTVVDTSPKCRRFPFVQNLGRA